MAELIIHSIACRVVKDNSSGSGLDACHLHLQCMVVMPCSWVQGTVTFCFPDVLMMAGSSGHPYYSLCGMHVCVEF